MNTMQLSRALYELTRACVMQGYETTGGFLGGEFGYGAYVDNDVFVMNPYCWCDREDCQSAPNFLFKPTGGRVIWYKYIGRSMEVDGDIPEDFLVKCIESLR